MLHGNTRARETSSLRAISLVSTLLLAVVCADAHAWAQTGTTPLPSAQIPGDGSQTFPETGKTVNGLFLDYWNTHGGLAQQGYPISDVMEEVSDLDGKTY